MVTNLTSSNLDEVKISRRIVAFVTERHVYVLASGPKNSAMFAPLQHDADYRYKCKNAKSAVKAAVTNGEQVLVCDTYNDLFRHALEIS
tara:strand:+ start:21891 stop:22157 length:267 start_codon:yes stop_codon:yes gene_type:complete